MCLYHRQSSTFFYLNDIYHLKNLRLIKSFGQPTREGDQILSITFKLGNLHMDHFSTNSFDVFRCVSNQCNPITVEFWFFLLLFVFGSDFTKKYFEWVWKIIFFITAIQYSSQCVRICARLASICQKSWIKRRPCFTKLAISENGTRY